MRMPGRPSPTSIIAGSFGTAIFVVFAIATLLGLSMTVRLALVMLLLVAAVVVLIVRLMMADRASKGLEQSMRSQAEQQQKSARPDRQGEIRQVQEQFDRALKTLKESKLVRGRRGSEALYVLPWYLFVGPPAAGKTTAIANSGLRFPLGSNRIRGVGGTRNCDWFFSDSAIILDTAGRYMTEEEDADEWNAFLVSLRKHRKHQPINGVMIGMSAEELARMSLAEVELHATAFRQRLDELVRLLGVRFPVYLVFTKCDLLAGFVEFFGDLTKAERDQVWGTTFELDETRSPADAFEAEFGLIMDTLLNERLSRLSRAMKREERNAIYAFPLELAALKERLALFVDQTFLENPYQDTSIFRGFYFTSGTQEGAPIDRVISAVAEELGIAPEPVGAQPFDLETKSYFLKDLFTDVVIPDQHVVRRTGKERAVPVAAIVAGVALFLFAIMLVWSARQSQLDIRRVEQAAVALDSGAPDSAPDGYRQNVVVRLDTLHEAIEAAQDGGWRLYNRDRVIGPASALWLSRTRTHLRTHGVDALEGRLQRRLSTTDGTISGSAWQELGDDLQAYLLLTSEARRLRADSARATRDLLSRHLTAVALADGVAAPDSAALLSVYRGFIQALGAEETTPFQGDANLVRRAQAALSGAPTADLSYGRLLRDGSSRFDPVTLPDIAGNGAGVFTDGAAVPGLFTKTAWESYVRPAIEAQAEQPDRSDWVVGRVEGLALIPDQRDDVINELRTRYFRDYAAAWDAFLDGLDYRRAASVTAATDRLITLGDPRGSPILTVLGRVAAETDFSLAGAEGQAPDGGASPGESEGGAPDVEPGAELLMQQFNWLHTLAPQLAASGGAAPELTGAVMALGNLGADLASGGGAERVPTYQQAVRMVQMEPSLRGRLFETPMITGGTAVENAAAAAAAADLNGSWGEAFRFYNERLSTRYPFDASSSQDALLEDIDAFFNPSSGLVAPFLGLDDEAPLSRTARSALARAQAVSRSLFAPGSLGFSIELEPDTPVKSDAAPPVAEYRLTLLGTSSQYDMGAIRTPLVAQWPGRTGAELEVQTRDGTLNLREEGDWALIRLLSKAEVQRRTSREYDLAWPLRTGTYTIRARYLLTTQAAAGLVQNPASFFDLQLPARLSR